MLTIVQPDEDKRTVEPFPWVCGVEVAPIDENGQVDQAAKQQAWTRNISATGVSLFQTKLAEHGRVLITIPVDGEEVSVEAEVRHWHPLGDNVIEVGCRSTAPPEREGAEATDHLENWWPD